MQFNDIDFSQLKVFEMDGGELEVEQVEENRPPKFYQYNGKLGRISIRDPQNRYLDLKEMFSNFENKVCFGFGWIDTMCIVADITYHAEISREIKNILLGYSLKMGKEKVWDNRFNEEDIKIVNKFSLNHEKITMAYQKIMEGYECVKLKIRNIPLDKNNSFHIMDSRVRNDAYCDFPQGTEIRVYVGSNFITLKDPSQYTVNHPLFENPYRYFEIKFRKDLEKGSYSVLIYGNNIRKNIIKMDSDYIE